MCGEPMKFTERQSTDRLPGSQQSTETRYAEWVCPECEYFEEADGAEE